MLKIKNNIKLIIGIIIGILIGVSITVKAVSLVSSNDVSYQKLNGTNIYVKNALDELYKKANDIEETNIYGIKREINNESSTWERIDDSVGLVANATKDGTEVVNDFDNIYPWNEIRSYNYDTDTKSITAWYGEDGFTFKPTDNTTEVLTYIPEFYYKRYQDNGYEYIYISKTEKEGFTKNEAFSIGRYTMSGYATRVHSRSGVTPLVSHTVTEFRNYARNLGEGFGQLDYHYFILQLLYLVEYADYNSQEVLGLGNTNNTSSIASGGCNTLGMKSGTINNDGKHSVIYRGVEDIFGNIWQSVDGINIQNNQAYISYNPSTYQVDKYDGDYKKLDYVNATVEGYISKLGYDSANSMVAIPIETTESNNTFTSDYFYRASENRIALIGGGNVHDTKAGLWYWHFRDTSSDAYGSNGARLLKTN